MKKLLLALFVATLGLGQAATITLNKGLSPGFNIITSTGTSIGGATTVVSVGSFSALPAAGAQTIAEVLATFREFGSTAAAAAGTAISGSITSSPATPANFNTLQMYLIVGNAATLAASTQWAVLTNSPATTFPADVLAAGSTNYNVNTFASNSVVASYGSLVDNATGADTIRLYAPVPEPSVTALLGLLGLVGLRRKR